MIPESLMVLLAAAAVSGQCLTSIGLDSSAQLQPIDEPAAPPHARVSDPLALPSVEIAMPAGQLCIAGGRDSALGTGSGMGSDFAPESILTSPLRSRDWPFVGGGDAFDPQVANGPVAIDVPTSRCKSSS